MSDLQSFYKSILNIGNANMYDSIKRIVLEEYKNVLDVVKDPEGFCRVVANNIEYRLKRELVGVNVVVVDLNELVNFDHVVLIAEYMFNGQVYHLIIDPTFSQFLPREFRTLIILDQWPGEKLSKEFREELETEKMAFCDNERFNEYLRVFGTLESDIDLDGYILDKRLKETR